ncbi:MAG: GAF domain-containing protein [Nitrospirae bacterium]|nr:MAG: GAF domain-containing protein [Nitrospirota bacterium]
MTALLPKDRRILEKGRLEFRPFGRERNGDMIRDVSGVSVLAHLEYLQETVGRAQGPEAGEKAVETVVELLNERIADPAYHVTPEFLRNPWNSYSNEFVAFLAEFCAQLSGDPQFPFNMGKEKFLSPIVRTLGRPFTVGQIYKMIPHFGQKFARDSISFEAGRVTRRSAVLRMFFGQRACQQYGSYLRGCAERVCQAAKGTIAAVPQKVHGGHLATIRDRRCVANGDDCCEWEVQWDPRAYHPFVWLGGGLGLSLLTWVGGTSLYPHLSSVEHGVIALLPFVIVWLGVTLWADRQEIRERERIIHEQLEAAESRHEELREAYLAQEHILVELRRRINELTTLHQTGFLLGSTLNREVLVTLGLQALCEGLQYDHAVLVFYDMTRGIMYDARVWGGTEDLTGMLRSSDSVMVEEESMESTVLRYGKPVLVNEFSSSPARLHPLYHDLLVNLTAHAFIAVPLKVQNRILGMVIAVRTAPDTLNLDDVNVLVTVANQMAMALDHARAYAEIEQLNIGLEQKVQERTAALQHLNKELEAANRRLKELDTMKSQFLSHCSHELRTPLTSIKGFTENLLHGIVGPLSGRPHLYLSRIKANVDRLTRMIADLLDLSRIESGTLRLVWGTVSVPNLLRDVVGQLFVQAQEKHQQLSLSCSDDTLVVAGDADRLHQVFTNLVYNAIKFTPSGGTIQVVARRAAPAFVEILVSDNGPGISPEAQATLFEPFIQAHLDPELSTKGLGLGLAIVKHLVDQHHGHIAIESEAGKGATFRVSLPAHERA